MKTVEFKFPRAISECIIGELEYSLEALYPKLFCGVSIEEKLLKVTIPKVGSIERLLKLVGIEAEEGEYVEMYTIFLPLAEVVYRLSYNIVKGMIEGGNKGVYIVEPGIFSTIPIKLVVERADEKKKVVRFDY